MPRIVGNLVTAEALLFVVDRADAFTFRGSAVAVRCVVDRPVANSTTPSGRVGCEVEGDWGRGASAANADRSTAKSAKINTTILAWRTVTMVAPIAKT